MKKRIAIYPGTFDPITNGHIDLIARGLKMFDELIVAVAINVGKSPMFSMEDRVEMVRTAFADTPEVTIIPFKGMIVDFANEHNCPTLLRGLRTYSDFEYEFQMALTNRKLSNDTIETAFLMAGENQAHVSSRLIREVATLGGDLHHFVPRFVEERLQSKFNR